MLPQKINIDDLHKFYMLEPQRCITTAATIRCCKTTMFDQELQLWEETVLYKQPATRSSNHCFTKLLWCALLRTNATHHPTRKTRKYDDLRQRLCTQRTATNLREKTLRCSRRCSRRFNEYNHATVQLPRRRLKADVAKHI